MSEAITLTGATLTLAEILAVARDDRAVRLDPGVAARVAASREAVERALAQGEAVYGLTTGLGANVGVALDHADLLAFQTRILVGRAVAVGTLQSRETVRAAILLRANGLARAALLDLGALAAALSFEGVRANPGPLLPEVSAARPAPGQEAAATALRRFLAGSALWQKGAARAVQDPLSFRCVAPVHGAALAALAFIRAAIEPELNAAADNPLVLAEGRRILSTGNFHTGALALAGDTLALALVPVADLAVGRTMKLMLPEASGLPKFLTPVGGNRAGFAPVQKTVAALRAECRHRANPASLDFTPVANGVEDHSPQTPLTLRKAGELCQSLRRLLAIELMVAAQAIDLRDPTPRLGAVLAATHAPIPARIPPPADD